MTTPVVVQLQQLRQLRERRAQNQLTLQLQRCRTARASLEQAQQQVDEALEQLHREALALQELLGAGALAVGTYQTALEVVDAFDQHRAQLVEQVRAAELECAAQDERRVELQRALVVRQQHCEALTPLLEKHQQQIRRIDEGREEELYDERAALRAGVTP
jgi:hypothetical protein